RAMPLARKFGLKNPMYQIVATTYGEILFDVDRAADARKLFDELIAAEEEDHSAPLGGTLTSRAIAENHAHNWADAAGFAPRAAARPEHRARGKRDPARRGGSRSDRTAAPGQAYRRAVRSHRPRRRDPRAARIAGSSRGARAVIVLDTNVLSALMQRHANA